MRLRLGHLANGAFALPAPLQVSGLPKRYTAPASNDPVAIGTSRRSPRPTRC
ncbi:hypothetical protein [Candidatus Solirubrobacter pratensis]|uniref:hypothetical protein n=1 Tax=Candidatus Solirubrobacter pratensis TaxID=1298857 RepID=UPI000426EDA9|nr:hypothetical protein [Candidatus Solirubrobacter pratensis]